MQLECEVAWAQPKNAFPLVYCVGTYGRVDLICTALCCLSWIYINIYSLYRLYAGLATAKVRIITNSANFIPPIAPSLLLSLLLVDFASFCLHKYGRRMEWSNGHGRRAVSYSSPLGFIFRVLLQNFHPTIFPRSSLKWQRATAPSEFHRDTITLLLSFLHIRAAVV